MDSKFSSKAVSVGARLFRYSWLPAAVWLVACASSNTGPGSDANNPGVGNAGATATSPAGGDAAGGSGVAATSGSGGTPNGGADGGSLASQAGTSSAGSAATSGGSTGASGMGAGNGGAGAGGAGAGAGAGGAGAGGAGAGGAGTTAVVGVCDLFASGKTPCVAAHSTTRALYGAYDGALYQVSRASDKATKDIGVLAPGSFADSATQDSFCTGTTCSISAIYDQSGNKNDLKQGPPGQRKETLDNLADATALKLKISGHDVYGVHLPVGYGYRVDKTTGVATADRPETEYMVTSGTFFNAACCFDYGNAETDNHDDGAGTMEAVYFGNWTSQGKGAGNGPWVMADMENGVFAGPSFAANPTDKPLTSAYVTAMVIGRSGTFALKGGNAQTGALTTMYDGARPKGYDPMKKQGAIVLGVGGDNTATAQGNFFEGALTAGAASDATAAAVQANIGAAGYGK